MLTLALIGLGILCVAEAIDHKTDGILTRRLFRN